MSKPATRPAAADLVASRAAQARDIGIDGIVCAATEAARVRAILGPDRLIVTPGHPAVRQRPGDQKRIVTPADAIRAGADHLVVAPPIVEAADPRAWPHRAIVDEISGRIPGLTSRVALAFGASPDKKEATDAESLRDRPRHRDRSGRLRGIREGRDRGDPPIPGRPLVRGGASRRWRATRGRATW